MSGPVAAVLARLDKPRPSGRDRWRAACPACGGNRSALSIGVAQNDAVLLRCWKGCSIEEIAAAIDLDVSDLFPARDGGASRPRKIGMLSATQALDLLADEANLVALAAANVAHGVLLTADDLLRVRTAAGRIAYLREEASR